MLVKHYVAEPIVGHREVSAYESPARIIGGVGKGFIHVLRPARPPRGLNKQAGKCRRLRARLSAGAKDVTRYADARWV